MKGLGRGRPPRPQSWGEQDAGRAHQPAMGGVLVGTLLTVAHEVMGVGYDYVGQALNGRLLLEALVSVQGA